MRDPVQPLTAARLLWRSTPHAMQLRAVSHEMRARMHAALPSIDVRVSICLPNDAVISQDECVLAPSDVATGPLNT